MPKLNKASQLATEILSWWEKHQYDVSTDGDGEEWNLYDEEPSFVKLAKEIIK